MAAASRYRDERSTVNDIPTDYLAGYEKARAIDPERAALYVRHTVVGDPLAEAMADDLEALDQEEARRFIEIGMSGDPDGALDAAPATVRAFFENAEVQPEWLDYKTFPPGISMFHRNSYVVLVAFVAGEPGWHLNGAEIPLDGGTIDA